MPPQNESNAPYTQGADGLIHVRYYLAPVGVAERDGWHPRDPSLGLTIASPTAAGAATATSSPGATPVGSATALAAAPAAPGQPAAASGRARPLALATAPATAVLSATAAALGTDTPALPPAAPPFRVQAAPDSRPGSQTTLTSEDGATLGIGLAAVGGTAPLAVPAQLSGDTAAYPAAATVPLSGTAGAGTAPMDFAVRQTVSGLVARLTLHGPPQDDSVAFALSLGAGASLAQQPDGQVLIQQPVQQCGGEGAPLACTTLRETEFRIGPAGVHDSGGAPADPAEVGAATVAIAESGAGAVQVALALDPRWLQSPARAFPVTLDLPIVTATSSAASGVFGSISNCTAGMPVDRSEALVGVQGSCTYRGLAYFDVTQLLLRLPIQSAMLHLFAQSKPDAAGVALYPNAPGPLYPPAPATPAFTGPPPPVLDHVIPVATAIPFPAIQTGALPNWATTPTPAATPLAADAGDPLSWDITGLVRGWAANRLTNTGLTLESSGPPVALATPLGAGASSPGTTPYLDITYAQPALTAAAPAARGGTRPA